MIITTDQLLAIYRSAADAKDERLLAATSRELLTRVHNSNPYLYDYPTIPEDLSVFREFPHPPAAFTKFHEQVRWMLEAHPMHLYAPFVDKRTVLDYVDSVTPNLTLPVYAMATSVEELLTDLDYVTNPCIIKLTNGCNANYALPDPRNKSGRHEAVAAAQRRLSTQRAVLREPQYRFPARIIVQPLLDIYVEAKLYCILGEPQHLILRTNEADGRRLDHYAVDGRFLGSNKKVLFALPDGVSERLASLWALGE